MKLMNRDKLRRDYQRVQTLVQLNPEMIDVEWDPLNDPPEAYRLRLNCRGVREDQGEVVDIVRHSVAIYLSPDYPVHPPILQWESPIFHPNILAPGVCLLGQWNSNTPLDMVCVWLWDMARYQLFN